MKTVLSIDTNFFSRPMFKGNGFVKNEYNVPQNLKKRHNWITIDDVKQYLPKKIRGSIFRNANSELYTLNQYDLSRIQFIHIGMHHHLYSHKGKNEYTHLNNPQQYHDYNIFIYLFQHLQLKKMTWVYPDYFTSSDLAEHFEMFDYKIEKDVYKISFATFDVYVRVKRWMDFKQQLKNQQYQLLLLLRNNTSTLKDDEFLQLREMVI